MKTLLLNRTEVGELIDLDDVLIAVENGYRSFSKGKVIQPDFMHMVRPNTNAGFDFKCGMDLGSNYISMKCSSGGYDDNPKLGLPTGINSVLLYEADTSALKCVMDGTWITGCRTAAAGAISVKYLAKQDASKLCIIGDGNQARRQLRAISRVRDIKEVFIWSYNTDKVSKYVEEMSAEMGIKITACATAKEAVEHADIVVTTTRARRDLVVKKEWVKAGTHIVAIGADMPDKQELASDVFAGAKIVNDSIHLCTVNGDTHHAIEDGTIKIDRSEERRVGKEC